MHNMFKRFVFPSGFYMFNLICMFQSFFLCVGLVIWIWISMFGFLLSKRLKCKAIKYVGSMYYPYVLCQDAIKRKFKRKLKYSHYLSISVCVIKLLLLNLTGCIFYKYFYWIIKINCTLTFEYYIRDQDNNTKRSNQYQNNLINLMHYSGIIVASWW